MMTLTEFLQEWNNESDQIQVQTSGSTGEPKLMMVEKKRMKASAHMTCDFLGLKANDSALLCMSLDYIGAKMMVVRALEYNMRLIAVDPDGHPLSGLKEVPDFAAMVPMQVFNSLNVAEEADILKQIKHLIIGGGPIDDVLERELRSFPNAVWSTYGMTETLSHIALRRINGSDASDWYTPLKNVSVSQSENGCLLIDAKDICQQQLQTNDVVEFNEKGQFKILGRIDNVIISGGIKIHIEQVENLLKSSIQQPFAISSRKSEKFGEEVVLLIEGCVDENFDKLISVLPKYWQPKALYMVDSIPFTKNGKPARKEINELIKQLEEHE